VLLGVSIKSLLAVVAIASTGVGSPIPLAVPGDSQVKISWSAPTQPIFGVAVEESLDSGITWITAARLPPTSTHVNLQSLTNGKNYWFRLRWIWLDNSLSIPSPTLVEIPMNPPSAPTGLIATASATQIGLSWDHATNKFIIGYEIEESTDGGNSWNVIQTNTGSPSNGYLINNVKEGTTYTFRIRALGFGGVQSEYSDSAVTKVAKAPTGGYLLTYSIQKNKVTLKWDSPTDVPDIQSYEVRISGDGGVNWFKIATTQGGVNTADVPYVIGGSTYQVIATSAEGLTSASQIELVQTNAVSNSQNTITPSHVPGFGLFSPSQPTELPTQSSSIGSPKSSLSLSKNQLSLISLSAVGIFCFVIGWLLTRSRKTRKRQSQSSYSKRAVKDRSDKQSAGEKTKKKKR
jgi:hypothetical protein